MKWLLFLLFMLNFAGCQTTELNGSEVIIQKRGEVKKVMIKTTFFNQASVKPIKIEDEKFNRVSEWYDHDSVIYQKMENGMTSLYTYHLFSGKQGKIYETHLPIISVKANENYNLFVVQELKSNYEIILTIINREGDQVFKSNYVSFDFQYIWNPYEPNRLLLISMLPNWEFSVISLDVLKNKSVIVNVDNPFVHWFNKESLLYLHWKNEEDYTAPLYKIDLKTGKENRILDNKYIAFFTYPSILLAISDGENSSEAIFTFYETNTLNKLNEFTLPVLNTYSEFWWIPEHDLVSNSGDFYYLKPIVEGSGESIKGHQFIVFSLNTGESEQIVKVDKTSGINCSPDGAFCLIGERLDSLVNIKEKTVLELVEDY